MIVSDAPIDWDFQRWRQTLDSYTIDGERQFNPASADDRAVLDKITAPEKVRQITEECPQVLARTEGKMPVTDDNMGTEWRFPLDLD